MNFSIVIPAHNEENSIARTLDSIEQSVSGEYEIIVVDDHSTDNTADIVSKLTAEYKNIRLARNKQAAGFANALRAGFNSANSAIIVPVMADLCDDPGTLNKMYAKIQEGFDIVCGSRYMQGGRKNGGPKLKSFFSRLYGVSLRSLIRIPTHDITNSFKMYKKGIINSITPESAGFEISVELPLMAFFAGYKISEIPTVWNDRKGGHSKFDVSKQSRGYFKLYVWALKRTILAWIKKKK